MTTVFKGPLAGEMEKFLAHKRALGRRFDTEEKALRLFDFFLVGQAVTVVDAVTPELLDVFLASRPGYRPAAITTFWASWPVSSPGWLPWG